MDGDQADRLFAGKRTEPLLYLARRKPKAARAHEIDANEIAVLGAIAVGLGDVEFAANLLLVDRDQSPAAVGQLAEDSEHAGFGVIDYLDDAPAISAAFGVGFLHAQQCAVADTGGGARLRAARNVNADLGRFAAFLIPFGGNCDQFAVAVTSGDVGHYGRRQRCRLMDFFALFRNRALVGQFAQDSFELDAVGVLQAE